MGAAAAQEAAQAPFALRFADLIFLAIALPVFVLADLPIVGYAAIAGVWLAQRALFEFGSRRTRSALASGDRRSALGFTAGATMGRVWMVALVILLVGGLGEREDGLAAAVMALVLVTVHLGAQTLEHVGREGQA